MTNPKHLSRAELIGLPARVISSRNRDLLSIQGVIVDETRNTLKIRGKDKKQKTVLKKDTMIQLTTPQGTFNLDCSQIIKKPHERVKK